MSPAGLAPLSQRGPGQGIDEARGDLLQHLPDDVKALAVGAALDYISAAERLGESAHTVMRLRGLLRRVIRGLYEVEVRRGVLAAPPVDFDPTTGRAAL
jgi:hypothetical protein